MKRIIPVLLLLLAACSREIPITSQPIIPPESPPAALPSSGMETVTDIPASIFPPASALPAGPVTIVALGDSLTEGDGDETGRGYTVRLLDMVNAIRPGSTITNFGMSGWNSDALINGDQGLSGQLTRALGELEIAKSQGRAAVALVWIGSNDLWYLYEYNEGTNENDSLDAEHFASNLEVILGQLRNAGA